MLVAMRSVGIILLLLAVATSASAECVLILWYRVVAVSVEGLPTPSSSPWNALESYKTLEDCQRSAAIEKAGARASERARASKGASAPITFYVCLPDTIDPRGPKGK